MPLTRYEVRNEYSLANPDLYRAAAKDDPEGLLEGVAMAGLVGIVRQLGDLAEFAAEVFHDLHEEVLATAARGHELLIRVQQLEAELPLVEKTMVVESNYVNFAYNPGVEWHANIHNNQNHFTQGDLPRFIRNAYEDCRGPPRLFLLDKFDVAGAGACLKRYTDPSFFRMEWASSELMKAEKEQQDKKARRSKKKGRRQRNGEIRDTFPAAHMQPRMPRVPSEVENIASTSVNLPISNSQHSAEQEGLGSKLQGHEHQPASSRLLIPEQEGPNLKASTNVPPQDVKFKEVSSRLSIPEQGPSLDTGTNVPPQDVKFMEVSSRLSIPEQGPSLETSTHVPPLDVKVKEVSSRLSIREQGPSLETSTNVLPQDAQSEEVSVELTPVQHLKVREASLEPSDLRPNLVKLESEELKVVGTEPAMQRTDLPTNMRMSEDVADDFASETDNYMDALTTMDSEVETDSEIRTIAELDEKSDPNIREGEATLQSKQATSTCLETSGETHFVTEDGASSSQNPIEEFTVLEKVEPDNVVDGTQADLDSPQADPDSLQANLDSPQADPDSPQASLTEEREPTLVDDFCASPSTQQRSSTLLSGSSSSTPPLEKSVAKSEEVLESESADGIPETPETPEPNESETHQLENLTSVFHQLPEPAVPLGNGSQMVFPEHLGSLSAHMGEKTSVLVGREVLSARVLSAHVDKHSFDDSESEASEGTKDSSPHSSANSSIQPMKWGIEFSKHSNNVLDSDDELEGMQVSSSSSSSSALSSPRPSTLATNVFNIDFDKKRPPLLSPQGSIKSSSESLLGISPHSAGSTAPHSPVSLREMGVNPSVISPRVVQTPSRMSPSYKQLAPDYQAGLGFESKLHRDMAVPAQNQSLLADESEHFPPPPPLPPLEWRMTGRFSGILSSSTKVSEFSARPPTSQIPLSRPPEFLQAFKPFTFSPLARQNSYTMPDEPTYGSKSTSWIDESQSFSMHANELQELSDEAASPPQSSTILHETPMQAVKSFSTKLPSPSNIPGRSDQLVQPLKASRMGLPATNEVRMKVPEASTPGHSASQSFVGRPNESVQSYRSFKMESADDVQNDSIASLARIDDCNVEGFGPPPELWGSKPVSSKVSADLWHDNGVELLHPPVKDEKIPSSSWLEETSKDLRPPLPSSGLRSERVSRPTLERKDSLVAAIAAHDKSSLKKVPEWSQSSRTTRSDDREVLLEQIRTGSFSLRHTKVKKQEAPRPVTSVNVAAILEKANAIRQAFAGSDDDDDEDDDWSD